jgi:Spy/CpxP family protein refolding chaperone
MLTDRKYRLLLWVTVFSVVLNLSLLGTVAYHLSQATGDEFSQRMPDRGTRVRIDEEMPRMFRNRFDLTPEQQLVFAQHHRKFRGQAALLSEQMTIVREQMMDVLMAEEPDTVRLNELSQQIGDLHARLKKASYVFYLELKEDCPPEQITQLNEMFRGLLQTGQPPVPKEGRKGKGRMRGLKDYDRTD